MKKTRKPQGYKLTKQRRTLEYGIVGYLLKDDQERYIVTINNNYLGTFETLKKARRAREKFIIQGVMKRPQDKKVDVTKEVKKTLFQKIKEFLWRV